MEKIKNFLQRHETTSGGNYILKDNEEITQKIIDFGSGQTDFHTLDINRLVLENERFKATINLFETYKTNHEILNGNGFDYNRGFVNAMNTAINSLKDVF